MRKKLKLITLLRKEEEKQALLDKKKEEKKLEQLKKKCDKLGIYYGHSVGIKTLKKRIKARELELKEKEA